MNHQGPDSDGSPVQLGQNPTLEEPFVPISPAHQRAIDDVEDTIDAFARGDQTSPLSIRGPFRTGKTALQYHAFAYAWKQGLPAVHVEASTLLKEYENAGETPFDTWVYQRMQEEAEAIAEGDLDSIGWFPPTAGSAEEWINNTVSEDVDTQQGLLLIDEVEQEYKEFISATGVDDDNPLRKLLDRPEMVPVLSMGQLSAFEFVGDADLGRMESISIPPITIGHIEDLLEENGADRSLGRIAYWLTRGRAARVHQVVTETAKQSLTPEQHSDIADWLSDYAQQRSTEFQPVRQVWESPEIEQPEAAAGALAFDQNGFNEWLIDNTRWHAASDVEEAMEQVIIETEPFTDRQADTEDIQEARRILRQTIRWVVHGIATPAEAVDSDTGDRAVPVGWITGMRNDRTETAALLSLIQDFLLAFEADREARDIAFDALETAKESFEHRYKSEMATISAEENDDPVWIARPTVLETAFPPLATDPSRLTSQNTEQLKERMVKGLEISSDESVDVYACPTQTAFEGQLEQLDPDPTSPVVILADEEIEIEDGLGAVPLADTLNDHDVLRVVSVPTTRVWEFVVQLFGRLEGSPHDPYVATEERVEQLVENSSNREIRTTIETLYGHLTERVAAEAVSAAVDEHRQQFARNGQFVWLNKHMAGESWVNPRAGYSTGRNAGFSLLVLGKEPDWGDPNGRLMKKIESGLDNDSIDQKGGFAYKELFRRIKESGGYGKPVRQPRNVCRNESDTGASEPVDRLEGAFKSIIDASRFDREQVLAALYEKEGRIGSTDTGYEEVEAWVQSLSPGDRLSNTDDALWAVITAGLARTDPEFVTETLQSVEDDLDDLINTLEGYVENVEAAEEVLAPNGVEDTSPSDDIVRLRQNLESQVNEERTSGDDADENDEYGKGIGIDASHIETYLDNIISVRNGVKDARETASVDADFRPTAYSLAILGSRYEHVVRDAVDELNRGTPTDGDLNNVRNLRNAVDELLTAREKITSDSEANELAQAVDRFTDDVLNLRKIQQSSRISVGDPDGDGIKAISKINRAALDRTHQVQELTSKLERLSDLRSDVKESQTETKRKLVTLVGRLDQPDKPVMIENCVDDNPDVTEGVEDTDPDETAQNMEGAK